MIGIFVAHEKDPQSWAGRVSRGRGVSLRPPPLAVGPQGCDFTLFFNPRLVWIAGIAESSLDFIVLKSGVSAEMLLNFLMNRLGSRCHNSANSCHGVVSGDVGIHIKSQPSPV